MFTEIVFSARRQFALGLLVLTLLAAGCGGSGSDVVTVQPNNNQPAVANATIMYSPTLASAANLRTEPVAVEVDAFRITGFSASGDVVFGPQLFPKAAVVEFVVPVTTVSLLVEDMVDNVSIGSYSVGVSLTAGQTLPVVDAQLLPIPVPGPQGPAGADGTNGANGANGTNGTNGTNGASGADGAPGPVGPSGPQGGAGPAGPGGQAGPAGSLASAFIAVTSSSTANVATNGYIQFDVAQGAAGGLALDTTLKGTPVVSVATAGTYLISYTLSGRSNNFTAIQLSLVDSVGTVIPGSLASSAGFVGNPLAIPQTVSGQAIVTLAAGGTVGLRVDSGTLVPLRAGSNSSSAVMTVVRLQ